MATIYDLQRPELARHLQGEPAYRVRQLWEGLYRQRREIAEITSIPVELRRRLEAAFPPALEPVRRSTSQDGSTTKWLWKLADGALIESVLMIYRNRVTVCISSQAGCAMGCGFCATGQAGFGRHLSTGEIVEQVMRSAREAEPRRLSNVVYMGMGEPLANYEAVRGSLVRLNEDCGISARSMTISTVGIVPGIRRLADDGMPLTLAVSLHAANDDLRNELVPANRLYPLEDLVAACKYYLTATRRRISLEWALISGVNDRSSDAVELAALARDLRAHVNLIPLNPTAGCTMRASSPERASAFRHRLASLGVRATIRRNRGADIDAACGQLRANHESAPKGR